jgi:hypothetical protein
VSGAERWSGNRLAVGPPGAVHATLARSRPDRRAVERSLAALPGGTPVVLAATAPGATRRCNAVASRAGVEVQREYLAFPTAAEPAYLVEDAPATVRLFVGTVLVAPPGSRWAAPLEACCSALRALGSRRLVRLLAPGRVIVGRRM